MGGSARRCLSVVTGEERVQRVYSAFVACNTSYRHIISIPELKKKMSSMKQFNCRVGLVCHAQPDLQASTGPVYNMKRKAGLVSFRYKKKRTQKQQKDRKSTRLNSSHSGESRMPSSA